MATTQSPPARRSTLGSTIAVLLGAAAVLLTIVFVVAAGSGSSQAPSGAAHRVDMTMGEFWFEPSVIEVPRGTELVVAVTNVGAQTHDLAIDGGPGTDFLMAGERQEVSLGIVEEDTRALCTVPGHLESGMVMDIVVTGP